MRSNDDTDAQAAKATRSKKAKTGKQIAEEEDSAGRPSALSVGREGDIDAGPDTQLAPGILDSGTF